MLFTSPPTFREDPVVFTRALRHPMTSGLDLHTAGSYPPVPWADLQPCSGSSKPVGSMGEQNQKQTMGGKGCLGWTRPT